MPDIIKLKLPTRYDELQRQISIYSIIKVKMVLNHGVSFSDELQRYFCDCGNVDCKSPGKHPIGELFPNGQYSATDDKDFLYQGLELNPNANLAIVIDGFTVFDIDDKSKIKWLKQFSFGKTRCISTGRGRHYYFEGLLPFKPKQIDGVEIKTANLITVPPSRHISGKIYRRIS